MKKIPTLFLIILIAPIIGGLYGIIHDQLTYTISEEYYTKFKFYQFGLYDLDNEAILPNPRQAVAVVGFMATWWMGLAIGVILGLVGLIHSDNQRMFRVTMKAFAVTIIITFLTGLVGLVYGELVLADKPREYFNGWFLPDNLRDFGNFISVGSMHNFSYLGGVIGLIAGIIYSIRKNNKPKNDRSNDKQSSKIIEKPKTKPTNESNSQRQSPAPEIKKTHEIKSEAPKSEKQSKRETKTPYIAKDEAEIKIIDSVPDPGKSNAKRIGYLPTDLFRQVEPYAYPVAKMPKENSLIKFPRKGRSDKKGYKEDEFHTYLIKYFKNKFEVFNDKHIPTENGRPYEPDFILENETADKNIFINIEIDEPYDGWLRTPTHCIGENNMRDDFFTKRGWIVIRFAEIQIHQDPKGCCAFIAKVIRSIDNSYQSILLTENLPAAVSQWNSLQAKKWAIAKYREAYLGINDFGKKSNVITEYCIHESDADKEVERGVPQTNNHIPSDKKGILAIRHVDPRDKRISFDPIEHRYFIDGNPDTISVTQLVEKFFPEFDSEMRASNLRPDHELYGLSANEIIKIWKDKGMASAKKWTLLHEAIENHYNEKNHDATTLEFGHFLNFKLRFNSMQPYRSEWRIFDEDLLIAGTIDMVYKKPDGSLYMFDWKRSEKIVRADGSIKNETYQFAFGELNHLGDNSYNKYCLQQNIYRAILEKRYGQKISSMNLLVLHELYDNFHHVQIPDMQKEVNYIFSHALNMK